MVITIPTIVVRKIDPEDEFIIIGSGGIWETKNNQYFLQKIRNKIKQKQSFKTILSKFLDDLLAKNTHFGIGCDNMTIMLI